MKKKLINHRKAPTESKLLDLLRQGFSRAEIARMFGVSKQRISDIMPRKKQLAISGAAVPAISHR